MQPCHWQLPIKWNLHILSVRWTIDGCDKWLQLMCKEVCEKGPRVGYKKVGLGLGIQAIKRHLELYLLACLWSMFQTGNVGTTVRFSVTIFTCQSADRCLFLEAENDIHPRVQCHCGSSMSLNDIILHDITWVLGLLWYDMKQTVNIEATEVMHHDCISRCKCLTLQ